MIEKLETPTPPARGPCTHSFVRNVTMQFNQDGSAHVVVDRVKGWMENDKFVPDPTSGSLTFGTVQETDVPVTALISATDQIYNANMEAERLASKKRADAQAKIDEGQRALSEIA